MSYVFQTMSFLINQRLVLRSQIISKQFRMLSTSITHNLRKSPVSFEESLDDLKKKPVKFTSSKAFNLNPHTAIGIRTEEDDTPWFQGPVIAFSLACFLIYFCIIREESDVDEQLGGRLYDKVDGLEKASILNKINYNKQYDLDSAELYARLKELEAEEAAARASS